MDQSKLNFLQNVLRYSTSHSDGTVESTPREMSPARRQWLEGALSSMSINPIDELKKCIKCISDEKDLNRLLEALETLKDWCEDINFAIDFEKISGYSILPQLLNNENSEIRALTCELIGTCAQNNPYCQTTLLASKILPLMFYKLDKDSSDEVRIKALFAISCLVRDFEEGQQKLIEGNGLDILIKALRSTVEKLQIKTCFLCSSICNNSTIKSQLTSKHLIETLVEMYSRPDSNIHEHLLSAITVLIDDNPNAIRQAKEMKNFNFKQILTHRINTIQDDPRYLEEKEMATKLFQDLFQN